MWNKSIKLVIGQVTKEDKEGFDTVTELYVEGVPANFRDLTRNDLIQANQSGYSADQNIEIMACNYSGEKLLIDEETGERYEVVRTFRKDRSSTIELICKRREYGTV